MASVPSGRALLANFPRGLGCLAFDLLRGGAGKALASTITGLAPQLDAGGALQQLAITLARVTTTKPLEQLAVELDLDR